MNPKRLLPTLLCAALLLTAAGPRSAPPDLKAYQLKAVFLLNFGKFIQWPESAFEGPRAPFRLCVLGDNPFREALDAAVDGEQARGHPIRVSYSHLADRLDDCHSLFIARSEQHRLGAVLAGLGDRPILTVSDIEGFTELGGQIQFVTSGNNVTFALHLPRLRMRGLEPNANLLRIAHVVSGGER